MSPSQEPNGPGCPATDKRASSETPPSSETARDPPAASGAPRRWLKPALFGAVLVALFIASQLLDFENGIDAVRTWIEGLGAWGPLAFIGLYILATVLMVPGAIPTLMSGALFGGLWGTVYASIGSTVGAACSFLIARYLAGDTVARWVQGKSGLERIDKLTLTHGALIVCIVRLVPLIPFNLVNYAFGLTHVKFWRYVLVSWICMLPGTFLYAAGTDVVLDSLSSGDVPVYLLAGVVLALVLIVWLGRGAARKLRSVELEDRTRAEQAGLDDVPTEGP